MAPSDLFMRETEPAELLIRGAHVLDPRAPLDEQCDIVISDGRIAELGAPGSLGTPDGGALIDAEGKYVFPAFVDPHVHLRAPGQEHKEDLETGTRSAAAGGSTARVAVPGRGLPARRAVELVLLPPDPSDPNT